MCFGIPTCTARISLHSGKKNVLAKEEVSQIFEIEKTDGFDLELLWYT